MLCVVGPQGPLISNDQLAAFVRAHPKRLVGVASVDLYQRMAGVRELRRCVRELGFRALRVVPIRGRFVLQNLADQSLTSIASRSSFLS